MRRSKSTPDFPSAERALLERFGIHDARSRTLAIPALRLRARALETGAGEPLVFVHGGGSIAAEWTPLLARMGDRRCIALDRPGCGLSDPFDYRGADLRAHAVAFMSGVLDALELDRADLVANSMGGLWSIWLALDRPERVRSLALLGAPALILGSSAPLPVRMLGVRRLNRVLARLQPSGPKQLRAILGKVAGPTAAERMWPEFVEAAATADRRPGAQTAWLTLLEHAVHMRGCRLPLDADELRRVDKPALLIWGDEDAFAGLDYGRRAAELMPDATLEVVEGGHLPWWDGPEECAALVSSFLETPAGARVA